jgi:hypothetical protein
MESAGRRPLEAKPMTESDWWACKEPQKMLVTLQATGKASDRKLRLFACACVRQALPLMAERRNRLAVEVMERFADAQAGEADRVRAEAAARGSAGAAGADYAAWWMLASVEDACGIAATVSRITAKAAARSRSRGGPLLNFFAERVLQADLLRDVFFNPFRATPTIAEGVLAWNSSCVVQLATGTYEDRDFSQERMGVLADALEEAGVSDAEVLGHCRDRQAVHVRGCWLVDAILGKS